MLLVINNQSCMRFLITLFETKIAPAQYGLAASKGLRFIYYVRTILCICLLLALGDSHDFIYFFATSSTPTYDAEISGSIVSNIVRQAAYTHRWSVNRPILSSAESDLRVRKPWQYCGNPNSSLVSYES